MSEIDTQLYSITLEGLQKNFIITACAVLIPLISGILLSLWVKKVPVIGKIASWANIAFKAISIPLLIMLIYYVPGYLLDEPIFAEIDRYYYIEYDINDVGRFIPVVIALCITHLLYMPAKYNLSFSYSKNIIYNGLGLISNTFKWSLISSMILINDIVKMAKEMAAMKAMIGPMFLAFIVVGIILVILELSRALIKQLMK